MTRHFLTIDGLTSDELGGLLGDAELLAADRTPTRDLVGRTVAMLFEKPSTRTRLSFHVAVAELGGTPLPLSGSDLQLGRGETIEDTARILSGYVHAVTLRTFGQDRVERLAAASSVPVINALSDSSHPCQALADLLTLRQRFGDLHGLTLAYVGDGNNVANSLARAGALTGMRVIIASPPQRAPDPAVISEANALARREAGATDADDRTSRADTVTVVTDPFTAVTEADAVYTDVWTSMGFEGGDDPASVFSSFQISARLMASAPAHAVVMHCLPAHRGEEIAAEVIDGPQSVVWQQAENRLHAQKALLRFLLTEGADRGSRGSRS